VRHVFLPSLVVKVAKVLATALVPRLPVRPRLNDQGTLARYQFPLHVAAQVEIAAVRDTLQLAELALGKERKGVLDVARAAGVVTQLFLRMVAQPQPFAGHPQPDVPLIPAVAPVLVPGRRRVGMAEELDLHLLKLARAEGEVPRGNLVAETLAHLRDA